MENTLNSSSNKIKRSTKLDTSESLENAMNDVDNFSINGPSTEKRMKKDDSGINGSDTSEDDSLSAKIALKTKNSQDSKDNENQSGSNSPDSGNLEFCNSSDIDNQEKDASKNNCKNSKNNDEASNKEIVVNENLDDSGNLDSTKICDSEDSILDKNNEDDDDDNKMECDKHEEESDSKYDPTPNTPKPKHKWIAPLVFTQRQYGAPINYSPHHFRYNCYGSLHMVERLELMYKMRKHDGCVNALNFNANGTKLATGSDDLDIIIWDWTLSEPLLDYHSGHRSNVFQAKFMPLSGDCYIISCARDGQVRIGELSSEGVCKATRKIAQHKGAAHKLAIQMDSPHTFLSCGEDAVVFEIDLRKEKPEKLVLCKENSRKVPLYSIFINPYKSYEYVVGGRDHYVRVYDRRYINQADGFLKKYCPEHLVDSELKANVTSVVYNYNGQEILASYNDEDIYTFSSYENVTTKYLHRYKGHRNSQTVKGVNYFGAKSEFIVSGSDCGFVFFWEKESEHIVKYMYGDEGGVVNCLEPHPHMPVIATSGLDDDVKIWVPSCENMPNMENLKEHIIGNMKEREQESRPDCPESFVDQTIWFLMQHLARARRRSHSDADPSSSNSNTSSSVSDVDEEEAEFQHAIQCNQS